MVIANKSKVIKKVDGMDSHVLKRAASDCRLLLSLQFYIPDKNLYNTYFARESIISKNDFAVIAGEITVTADDVVWRTQSPEGLAWLKDQIEHAEKDLTPPDSECLSLC
jgi:hypothetical protein